MRLFSLLRINLFVAVLVFDAASPLHAQQNYLPHAAYLRPISASDSMLVKRYIDSVNNTGFFSRRRQLYLDSALAITPWKAGWWQQKGMALMKEGKYEAGMKYIDSAVKYDVLRYIDYRAFMKCIFQKSYVAAIKDFETAKVIIGAGGVMDHAYDFYIGLCYLQLDQLDSARYYLTLTTDEQLKSRGEGYVHHLDLFYLGIVYYEMEDYTKAIEIFDKSLKLYNNFSDVQYYKGRCLVKLNRLSEALALMVAANDNFKQGYTINEDNVVHEFYPYQVHKQSFYDNAINDLQVAAK